MSIFSRMGIIRALIPHKETAAEVTLRWHRAARQCPELVEDVIRLGNVLTLQPDQYDRNGVPMGAPIDPVRLAYEAGRRDFAVQMMAMMGTSRLELQSMMEADYELS